jgi:hypothetical protein
MRVGLYEPFGVTYPLRAVDTFHTKVERPSISTCMRCWLIDTLATILLAASALPWPAANNSAAPVMAVAAFDTGFTRIAKELIGWTVQAV